MAPSAAAAASTEADVAQRMAKFLCSFGGSILPRPLDGRLRYVGGDTRIVKLPRDISYSDLAARMRELYDDADIIKYQQPDEDLDALVTVVNDDDVVNMMEEYDKLIAAGEGFTRLRVILFSQHLDDEADDEAASTAVHYHGDEWETERRYVDALNSLGDMWSPSSPVSVEQRFGIGGNESGIPDIAGLRHLNVPRTSHNQRYGEMDSPWSPAYISPGQYGVPDPRDFPISPSSARFQVGAEDFDERIPDDFVRYSSYMGREVLERILDGREKPTNLSLALLKDITENFSDDREIGHGGFATVYKGVLRNGNIAVKRIRNSHSINETLFYREVDSLLNIKHKNVVRFLGFCASTDQTAIQIAGSKQHIYAEVRERLLCFEYVSNGSLQKYVTDELRGLEWNTRYGIIRGICEGLHHLHTEKHIYHMDLKPDNILLDNDMVPKITDFGLSRLDEKSKTMSEVRLGSLGYCAPEYISKGELSLKSDMYSLGRIIIELVTGGKEIVNNSNNVLRRWRHRWKKSGKETPLVYQQVAKCIEIGLLCQEREPSKRPLIRDIINDIRHMEVVNEEINNANEYTFGKISSCLGEDDMLGIEPLKLHFPFALNKQMSCEIQLTNETDSYIAFNIQNMSPMSYNTQPQQDIMPPRSKCNIEITLQAQGNAPRDMQRANEFVVWSTKVKDGITFEDITKNMFIKEAVNVVDEVNLDVVFDVSEPHEASDETSETMPPLIQIIDDTAGKIYCIDANQKEPLIIVGTSLGNVQT